MNKMLLVVTAAAAVALGGCTSISSADPAVTSGVTPPPQVSSSTATSSPEPTFISTPFALPPPEPPAPEPPAPEPPAPEPQDECDPNYAGGCVPVASDVDCAGGSGNGPAYVQGPVRVVGSDIYELDRDKDGEGCDN